jgi:hypothetical protein
MEYSMLTDSIPIYDSHSRNDNPCSQNIGQSSQTPPTHCSLPYHDFNPFLCATELHSHVIPARPAPHQQNHASPSP